MLGMYPHQMDGKTTTIVPSQNPGTEMKIIAMLRATWSPMVSWRIAEYMPMGTPISRDTKQAENAELDGDRNPYDNLVDYGSLLPQGVAQRSVQDEILQPARVLDVDWHVQAQLLFEIGSGDVGEVVHPRCHHVNDVARNETDDEEDDQGDEKERRNDEE